MSYSKIPAGKDLPNDIYVAIEIPANHAPIKYEIDKDSDTLFVDRFMTTAMNAFVGPKVRVGEGAILGARAVALEDLEPWSIYLGNPATKVRAREFEGR